MARNIRDKTDAELAELRQAGLSLLYIGPESGDDPTLKRIAKGDGSAAHVLAAERAHAAGMQLSVIALLGIAMDRSDEHARATAELVTKMNPAFFSALTVTIVPGTPLDLLAKKGRFAVPPVDGLLRELRTMVDEARPTDTVFRTNHASNYLPLGGHLPRDRARIVAVIDAALAGEVPLRPERTAVFSRWGFAPRFASLPMRWTFRRDSPSANGAAAAPISRLGGSRGCELPLVRSRDRSRSG